MVAHSISQVSMQDMSHYLLITKRFGKWFGKFRFMELLLQVCLVVEILSGTKMWSSKCPDHQAAGKKTLLSDHGNIISASEKRNIARNNVRRGYLKKRKRKMLRYSMS